MVQRGLATKILAGGRRIALYWRTHPGQTFWAGVGLVALWYIVVAGMSLARAPLGFDEGWDLQAPLNLAQHGQYASMGAAYDGRSRPIDPFLSTGPAVLFPIALVFRVFGAGAVQARLVIMAFYIAAIFLLAWYVYDVTKSRWAIIAPLVFLSVSSPPIYFRLDILGEIPAVAFGLASLIAWRKTRFGLAGVLMALAVLCKVVMFFLLFAAAAMFLWWLMRRRTARSAVLVQAWHWLLGLATPLVAWELFKLAQLGSVNAYAHNWHQYIVFFRGTGSGIDKNGLYVSAGRKWDLLLSAIHVPRWWLTAAAILLGVMLVLKHKQAVQAARWHAVGLVFCALYVGWWLTISNGQYIRYVVPLVVISVGIALGMALQPEGRRGLDAQQPRRILYLAAAGLLLLGALVGIYKNYFPFRPTPYSPTLALQQQIARQIAASHPAALTHIVWWQNPEMLFLGDFHSTDERLRPVGAHEQLLIGPIMLEIEPKAYARAQKECTHTYIAQAGYIYCDAVKAPAAATP